MARPETELKTSEPEFSDFTTVPYWTSFKNVFSTTHLATSCWNEQTEVTPHYGNLKTGNTFTMPCLKSPQSETPPSYVKLRDRWHTENLFLPWEILCVWSFIELDDVYLETHNRNCVRYGFRLCALPALSCPSSHPASDRSTATSLRVFDR